MTPSQTKLLITSGAALTCALIWFAPNQAEQTLSESAKGGVAPKLHTSAGDAGPLNTAAKTLDQPLKILQGRGGLNGKDASTLFAKISWVIPSPAPRPSTAPLPTPAPPPPTAPPLPYVFIGKFDQDDSHVVILTQGTRVLTVSEGDVLEKTYRIERIEANKVTFIYLPLGTMQTLSISGSQ